MKNTRFTTLFSLGIFAGICLANIPLNAWERKAPNYERCAKNNEDNQRCQKEADEDNQHDFEVLLSTDAFTKYNDFLPEQKQSAMDYADRNKMSPDDAVEKVYAESQ